MLLIDSHVHIYSCFNLELLLDSALSNFQEVEKTLHSQAGTNSYMLFLAEGENQNWYDSMASELDTHELYRKKITHCWEISSADREKTSLTCSHVENGAEIHILPGKQIVTQEGIELLVFFSGKEISGGRSLAATAENAWKKGAMVILPWGAGKWLGNRGKRVGELITRSPGGGLFLGDNGGRPSLIPDPKLFCIARKRGLGILRGSDPLPLPYEEKRVGSFGFAIQNFTFIPDHGIATIKTAIASPEYSLVDFGKLHNSWKFIVKQTRLRIFA